MGEGLAHFDAMPIMKTRQMRSQYHRFGSRVWFRSARVDL